MSHALENRSDRPKGRLAGGLSALWQGLLYPLLQRPKQLQVAALCHRGSGAATEVLLITSRDTGRWVVPKGWPMRGLDAAGAARQEAWEEAGVMGRIAAEPVGRFSYDKRQSGGLAVPVEILVYPLKVSGLAEDYPEAGQRRRVWFSPAEASQRVDEPGLQALLRDFVA